MQRLYKRRKVDANGIMKSTMGSIMSSSVREGNAWTTLPSSSNSSISGDSSSSGGDSWGDMDSNSGSEGDDKTWGGMDDL